ncbi:MAG: tetratricopeptide repeat protein [Pseudomonadota bacterium]
MKRASVCLFVLAVLQLFVPDAFGAQGRFIDPVRGVAFEIPAGWKIAEGFGDVVVELRDGSGGRARVKRMNEPVGAPSRDLIALTVAREFGGALLKSVDDISAVEGKALAASFDIAAARGGGAGVASLGLVILVPSGGSIMEVSCSAPSGRFIEVFFECRGMAGGLRTAAPERHGLKGRADDDFTADADWLPSPSVIAAIRARLSKEPDSFAAQARLVAARSLYAFLDGRGSCPGVAEEPRRFANVAARAGAGDAERIFLSLASLLDGGGAMEVSGSSAMEEFARAMLLEREDADDEARKIYRRFAKRRDGFFALLALARMDLAEGDAAGAEKILSKAEGGSNLAAALRIRAARIGGDAAAAASVARGAGVPFCGTSGAIAAHELGLATREADPAGAARLFRDAIEADPSYAPAYASLGRLALESGGGKGAAIFALASLLARAPDTKEIRRLKEGIGSQIAAGGK